MSPAILLFQIWSELLWVADECQGFDSYREFLTEELACRARKVPIRIRSRSNHVYLYSFKTNCWALISLRHRRNHTWLSPSAKQRRNPPPLYQDLSTHHFGPLLKKPLAICQSGWKEIRNSFSVVSLLGPRTRISPLLRRSYQWRIKGRGLRGPPPFSFRPNWGPRCRK